MKTLFFTKFPPPHTGQTVGSSIFARMVEQKVQIGRIDTSFGSIKPDTIGADWLLYQVQFSVQLLRNLARLRFTLQSGSYRQLYFVASPSLLGHVRDLLTVAIARSHVDRIVAHVHNGNFCDAMQKGGTGITMPVLMENVDTFVFTSRLLSDQVSSELPASKRAVVHNTVDEDVRCSQDEVREKINRKANCGVFRILFLSNMAPSKGYADVVEAIEQLRDGQSQIPLHLDLVGDWPDETRRQNLEERLVEDDLADHVTVHGRVTDREKVRGFFLNADTFVLPTYYPNEAQPISIIEAMNAGTPIIATSHASIPEYVTDDHNGYLVSKQAPSEIAQAIERLYDREDWTRKARAARKTYEDGFSPESVRDQLFEALALDNHA